MTLCVIPFISVKSNTRGDIKLCCQAKSSSPNEFAKTETGRRYNIAIDNIEQVWNSQDYRTLRKDMLDGKRNATCQKCYEEEDAGIESPRLRYNERFKDYKINYEEVLDFSPQYMDIRLSTLCNLKCRMCTPFYSSQWVDEWNGLSLIVDDPVYRKLSLKEMSDLKKSHWSNNDIVYKNLEILSDTVTFINLAGGEPTIIKQNIELLKMIINKGRADKVTLQYETNLTNISNHQLELWKHFESVILRCSIDHPSNFIKYIRYPADWKSIEENFKKLYKMQNGKIYICTVVSAYSIMRLPDMIDWANQFPKATLYFSLLESPNWLSIKTLPRKLKEKVISKLDPYMEYDKIPGIVKIMNSENWDTTYFQEFKNYTNYLDNSRNEKLTDYIPEFKEYGFD